MLPFLYIAASLVVGLVVGWLLRGRALAGQPATGSSATVESVPVKPIETPERKQVPAPALEPSADAAPVVDPERAASPERSVDAAVDPDHASVPGPSADAVVVVDSEPIAERVSAPEPSADGVFVAPEPAVEPEPALDAVSASESGAASGAGIERAPEPADEVSRGESAPAPAEEAKPEPAAAPLADVMPTQRTGEPNAVAAPDNLLRIEGIGPKMGRALNAAGITTFEQLAAADEAIIRAAISAAGMRFAPSLVTWPRQARLLAGGTGPDELQDRVGAEPGR